MRFIRVEKETYDMAKSFLDVYINEIKLGKGITLGELFYFCVWDLFQEEHIREIWQEILWNRGQFERYEKRFKEIWP